ncbi:MAG: acyl carrier protein [Gammaproteobacteria bacterium]|nr:acyl carrier protein [Gammaproteobacteria bacterium]
MTNATTPTAIAETVEAFIRRRFDIAESDPYFSRQSNLWDEGYVDSLGMTELIVFLESTFAIQVPDTVLFSPQFTSIDGIASLVEQVRDGKLVASA